MCAIAYSKSNSINVKRIIIKREVFSISFYPLNLQKNDDINVRIMSILEENPNSSARDFPTSIMDGLISQTVTSRPVRGFTLGTSGTPLICLAYLNNLKAISPMKIEAIYRHK